MPWLIFFAILTLIGLSGTIVNANRLRFERRVTHETTTLLAQAAASAPHLEATALPPPVARYRHMAVGDRAPVRTLRLHHRGTFAMSATSKALPIVGTQLFTADPPGFLWSARIRMAPGAWVDARDMLVSGRGSMRVLVDDTVTVADAQGPQIDQGSALRLLAEMVWYPTALFDTRW